MRSIIIMTLCMTLFLHLKGQELHSFPDTAAIWSVNSDKYSVAGDTMINSINYKKYFRTQGDSIFSFDKAKYYAALREDSLKRVWAIKKDSIKERLLYDFSLELGDTIVVYPIENTFWQDSFQVKIAQIDSIIINLSNHKRYKISSVEGDMWIPEYWIEGIGSTTGIFSPGITMNAVADISYPELLCYFDNNTCTYMSYINTCFMPLGTDITDLKVDNNICSFYPNPFDDFTILHISNMNGFNYMINFYSISGVLHKSIKITNNDFKIYRAGLPSGIYLYRLINKHLTIDTGKIIIK